MVRLAQELADLSNSLPSEYTNSMFARLIRIVLTLSRQLSLEQRILLTLMAALNLIFSETTITLMTLPR